MTIIKCKMCGGELNLDGGTVATCDYCGTQQTLPNLKDDRLANLYDRAGHFRRNNEFDKAMSIYEQILNENTTDAEAYWSLVLCRYGIEYVEDPATHKRIPTVNRTQFTSIFDDDNYRSALLYADEAQRSIYEAEARAINEIQKGILAISQQEAPFDVFICYKETDSEGKRTQDSVIAQELYYELTEMGYKVFFARITLEDKLGSAYEPFIFAALNSAKVMVALGTRPEHFRAVWVRNEWSRYLALIKGGAKKMLIPAYRDMDPYDLPEEFSHLQAQDMAKLGFMQDLVRGIQKLVGSSTGTPVGPEPRSQANSAVAPLIKRIELFLENGDWDSAGTYCDKVLDMDPENGKVYVYQLLAQLRVSTVDRLIDLREPFSHLSAYKNVMRFADGETAGKIEMINGRILKQKAETNARAEQERKAAEARMQQERMRYQAEADARAKQERLAQEARQYQENRYYRQNRLAQLEEEHKSKKKFGILLLFFCWPIGVFLLIQASKIKQEIDSLKRGY